MILKVLLVVAVIGIVYFLFIKKKPLRKTPTNNKKPNTTDDESNDMVQCTTCGVYSELSHTVISNNKYYCSDTCIGKA